MLTWLQQRVHTLLIRHTPYTIHRTLYTIYHTPYAIPGCSSECTPIQILYSHTALILYSHTHLAAAANARLQPPPVSGPKQTWSRIGAGGGCRKLPPEADEWRFRWCCVVYGVCGMVSTVWRFHWCCVVYGVCSMVSTVWRFRRCCIFST
jgi:hypothetical protein